MFSWRQWFNRYKLLKSLEEIKTWFSIRLTNRSRLAWWYGSINISRRSHRIKCHDESIYSSETRLNSVPFDGKYNCICSCSWSLFNNQVLKYKLSEYRSIYIHSLKGKRSGLIYVKDILSGTYLMLIESNDVMFCLIASIFSSVLIQTNSIFWRKIIEILNDIARSKSKCCTLVSNRCFCIDWWISEMIEFERRFVRRTNSNSAICREKERVKKQGWS